MQDVETACVGVDVAKDELVAQRSDRPGVHKLPNQREAIGKWLRNLPTGSSIAMESTGPYHRLLAELAQESGHRVFVLNARDVHFYAKALGMRGKTDRTDAEVILRFLMEHQARLHPWVRPSERNERLHQLLRCQAKLTDKRSAVRLLLRGVGGLDAAIERLEQAFEQLLGEIDGQIDALVRTDERLQTKRRLLQGITGVGPRGSAVLLALFDRLPFRNGDAVVAYSGLDPRPQDSGNSRGRRKLSKRGPPALRRQLWLCAAGARNSKLLGPMYRALRDRGLSDAQALVIMARKILRIAWSVWNSEQPFDATRLTPAGACEKT
jgi:transposase